jgi:hypothetical protein
MEKCNIACDNMFSGYSSSTKPNEQRGYFFRLVQIVCSSPYNRQVSKRGVYSKLMLEERNPMHE